MVIITEIPALRQYISYAKSTNKSIGFVATMGALHDGHLSLIKSSVAKNDLTVCSIFVNPTQFNNKSDLENYPRQTENDISLLAKSNCDMVFMPSTESIYRDNFLLSFNFGYLEETMEGKFRPGHFGGVGLIVTKLFNLVTPDRAYFGKKDLQQLTLIKILAEELFFDIEIVAVDTVREKNGLAMSSRNSLLSDNEKQDASQLHQALLKARKKLIDGDSVIAVKHYIKTYFDNNSAIDLEYFEIVDSLSLRNIDKVEVTELVSLCIAGYLGKVRLIDNLSLI